MADLDRQATELETLMHSLSFADEGAGVVQTANTTMRQKDIDFLVAILQELQELDVMALTPMDAINRLFLLREKARKL